MNSVLFVCTANVCRSPMAMAIFKAQLGPNVKDWRVESAGTWAMDGNPAAEGAQQVLHSKAIDLGEHRSRSVSLELMRPFNLILTMERGHKEALRAEFPELAHKIFLLSEMAGLSHNILDPIGGSPADFKDTAEELERLMSQGYAKIARLAKGEEEVV